MTVIKRANQIVFHWKQETVLYLDVIAKLIMPEVLQKYKVIKIPCKKMSILFHYKWQDKYVLLYEMHKVLI